MKNLVVILALSAIVIGCATPVFDAQTGETTYIPNTNLVSYVETVQEIAPAVPQPYGALLGLAGTIAGLIGTGVATWQNSRKKRINEVLTSAIESGPETTKRAVETMATAAGVEKDLNKILVSQGFAKR